MARRYAVSFTNITQTGAGDILEMRPGTLGESARIISIFYGQHSDPGDAAAEMARMTLYVADGTPTSGSGGTTVTPRSFQPGENSQWLPERHNSTPATNVKLLLTETFNWQAGWFWRPTPEERLIVPADDGMLVVRLETTPNDALSTSLTLIYEVGLRGS